MISFSAFVDELVKIARVPKAVKQYRRYVQLMQGSKKHKPGFAHGTTHEGAEGILDSGKILPGKYNAHGKGTYFAEGRSEYGPVEFVSTRKAARERGVREIKTSEEASKPFRSGDKPIVWARTDNEAFPIRRGDTAVMTPYYNTRKSVMDKAQKRGLRVIEDEPASSAQWDEVMDAAGKKELIKALRNSRKRYI